MTIHLILNSLHYLWGVRYLWEWMVGAYNS